MSVAKDRRSKDGSLRVPGALLVLGLVAILFAWHSQPLHVVIASSGAFIALLVVGCYLMERAAVAAVLDERRRMARDLHDGLAQELAFIRSQAQRLVDAPDASRAASVVAAAERALDESRAAIKALTRRSEDPFDAEVAQVAEQLTARAGARLRLDLDRAATASAEQRDELLRILREAVTNGVRHGRAEAISVELEAGEALRLVVRDNGTGFDPEAAGQDAACFGLTSMRERAAAIGARLRISSHSGKGTAVEVVLP
jgi:signal transduction histidine kinase